MKKYRVIFILAMVVLCSSCGTKQNLDYLDSTNSSKLIVPPPLTTKRLANTFVLPNVGKIDAQTVNPPGLK